MCPGCRKEGTPGGLQSLPFGFSTKGWWALSIIASPPYAWPCYYGIDTGTKEQLLANGRTLEEIREFIGADSLEYLSVEALYKASDRTRLCTACFDGNYPTDLYQE